MTAPTHIAFSATIALMFGYSSPEVLLYLSIGSVLPDIDHPKSFIGKLLFFLSIPLNKRFGHRGLIHSVVVWLLPLIIGFIYFKPLFIICLGIMSHIILDSWNIAGVHLLKPVSEKTYVIAQKKYRIASGSKNEFVLLVILLCSVGVGSYFVVNGGVRNMLQKVLGDYTTAVQHYCKEGKRICYMDGDFRKTNGEIISDRFLIVGKDDSYNITILYEKTGELFQIPKDGEFNRCYLEKSEKEWQAVKINEPMTVVKGTCFYKLDKIWISAKEGDVIAGNVLHRGSLEIKSYEYQN